MISTLAKLLYGIIFEFGTFKCMYENIYINRYILIELINFYSKFVLKNLMYGLKLYETTTIINIEWFILKFIPAI